MEAVVSAQAEGNNEALGIDCDTGDVRNMLEMGVVDPVQVKLHAIRAAGEVAVAILRIDTIIKKKEEGAGQKGNELPNSGLPDF